MALYMPITATVSPAPRYLVGLR